MKGNGNWDTAIIGGGPAGAATALYLLKAGIRPLLIEQQRFPRYHIGESLTGEVGLCIRQLGLESKMKAAGYPVKHGVNVYGPSGEHAFWVPVKRRDPDGNLQSSTTWQVRRSTFDQMLLDQALEQGAEIMPARADAPLIEDDRVQGVRVRFEDGTTQDVRTRVLVDASGQSTFLARSAAPTSEIIRGRYDRQLAVFTQVTGAQRDPGDGAGNTLIFYAEKNHWAWFIPIDDEVVSVGVVVPSAYFTEQGLSKAEFLEQKLKTLNPELSRRLENATIVEEVRTASNYSYHVKEFTGKGFLCVGDSHRFVDPIFSFGVNFALKEAQFAAAAIKEFLDGKNQDAANPFQAYQDRVERGQNVIQDLVDVFWDRPLPFVVLVHHDRHREGMIDLFAGRIFSDDILESPALHALRACLPVAA